MVIFTFSGTDGQATADTGLLIAQQTAASTLATAQALCDNATSFQYSTTSDQLPGWLVSGVGLSLAALEYSPASGATVLREGVQIPMAWPYQAGYLAALGFGYTYPIGFWDAGMFLGDPSTEWRPIGLPQAPGRYLRPPPGAPGPAMSIDFDSQLPTSAVDLAKEATTVLLGAYLSGFNSIIDGIPLPGLNVLWGFVLGPQPAIAAATPDDAAHQDASGDTFGFGFDATPLATMSAESQAADAATPTAAEEVKEVEAKVGEQPTDPFLAAETDDVPAVPPPPPLTPGMVMAEKENAKLQGQMAEMDTQKVLSSTEYHLVPLPVREFGVWQSCGARVGSIPAPRC